MYSSQLYVPFIVFELFYSLAGCRKFIATNIVFQFSGQNVDTVYLKLWVFYKNENSLKRLSGVGGGGDGERFWGKQQWKSFLFGWEEDRGLWVPQTAGTPSPTQAPSVPLLPELLVEPKEQRPEDLMALQGHFRCIQYRLVTSCVSLMLCYLLSPSQSFGIILGGGEPQ